jgi:hypothetical protein
VIESEENSEVIRDSFVNEESCINLRSSFVDEVIDS